MSAAAGVSIITPIGTEAAARTPERASASASSSIMSLESSSSSSRVTSGSMSCSLRVGRGPQHRAQLRAGRSPDGRGRPGSTASPGRDWLPAGARNAAGNLSPPRSKTRIMTGSPGNESLTRQEVVGLLVFGRQRRCAR